MNPQKQHTLPEGWEMKKLKDFIFELEGGVSVNAEDRKIQKGEFGILKTSAVTDCKFDPTEHKTILTKELYRAKLHPKKGNILISRMNTPDLVGLNAYVNQDYPNLFIPDRLWQTVFKENCNISHKWLAFCLSSEAILKKIKEKASGTSNSMKNISKPALLSLEIITPPLPEQRRIADVLSTWDRAIEQTNELLKTLRARHRGLMHQLLTGKVRLPGFVEAWKHLEIGEVAQEISIRNKQDKSLTVLSCTKYNGLVDSLTYFGRKIFSDDLTTYKIVSRGEFAYATNHIEEGSIGYQSAYDSALISPMYTVFRTDSTVDHAFLYFLLKTDRYIQEYKRNMVGSIDRRGGLRWNDFSKIVISLPSLAEQRAIAQVLDVSLKEIQQQEVKLEALREQKRGLMQCLLTGRVRVPAA